MAISFGKICAATLIIFVLSTVVHPFMVGAGETQPEEKINFSRIGVLDPEDRTGQSVAGVIGKIIRSDLAETFRFEVVPQPKLSRKLPLSSPELIKIATQFNLDGIITGRADLSGGGIKLELLLLDGETAKPIAKEYTIIPGFKNPEVLDQNIGTVMAKLINRIPYQARVTEVRDKGRVIMINAGRLNGLGVGMTVRIYEIGKLNKNPFTGELIGIDEVVIGEWKVIRADDRTSMCRAVRTSKGRTVNVGQYVGFEPSEKIVSSMAATRERILAQLEREWSGMDAAAQREASQKATGGKPTKQSSLPKPSRGRVEFDGGWGWSHYSLNSDSYDLNQNVSSFPVIRAAGEYWVIPSVGIDADYQIGFFKLDSQGGSSISAKARPTWITTNLMYRWFFSPGHANLELIGRAGYAWYNYHLSETNSQYLINARYRGLNLGIEVRLPISTNFSAEFGTDYQPAVAVTEEPATSGENPSAWALEAHAELLYRLDRGLWMSIRYQIENYSASFSGTGTRAGGISGAKTSDQLNNVSLGLVFQF